jgi:transcriptional regulator GlxA family with amidase domain
MAVLVMKKTLDIVIYIYNGITMLDVIGPYEVLKNLENVNIKFVSKEKGEINADSELVQLISKHDITEIERADILLIPGSSIAFISEMKDKKVLDWIRKINETTVKTVSVCTGSIILAATGLLEGKKATSHWKPIELLKDFGAIPVRERIVEQGKFITAAGVSSGIDMGIYLAGIISGEKEAKASQLMIEYDPKPMFDSGNFLTAEPEVIELAQQKMQANAKKHLSLWKMLTNIPTLMKLSKRSDPGETVTKSL